MRLVSKCFGASLTVLLCLSFTSAQMAKNAVGDAGLNHASAEQPESSKNEGSTPAATSPPEVWIHLVGGRKVQVDDVTEAADGIWYTRNNVSTFIEASRVVRIERSDDRPVSPTPDTLSGTGRWKISDSSRVENFFVSRFKRPLPLTAFGQSDLHTRWGLDHRHGIDVGLHPDSVEGKALIQFLRSEEIPFLAFRSSVPGVATGPHIHIGNGSPRMRARQ